MSLNIFFIEDVISRIEALKAAAWHIEPGEFRRGWLAALDTVALAFGLAAGTALTIPHHKEVIVEGHELERR